MVSDVERIAILETKFSMMEDKLISIEGKLDDLLTLKSKGMGALQLIGLIIGSGLGIIGVIVTLANFFGGKSVL